MLRFLSLCVLASCGRFGFAEREDPPIDAATADMAPVDAGMPSPIHRYPFDGNLDDKVGGTSLVALMAGTFELAGYRFPMNGGLVLDSTALPAAVYTIDMILAVDQISSWRKLIDFDGGGLDRGLYVYEGALEHVLIPNPGAGDFVTSAVVFAPSVTFRLTLTRDATNRAVAYINKAPVAAVRTTTEAVPVNPTGTFAFDDPARTTQINAATVRFFVDDSATVGNEAAPGIVRQITIWDVPLTEAQVAAL